MQNLFYSVVGLIAIIVHLILNSKMYVSANKDDNEEGTLHIYLISVFLYYITDALWGILAHLGNTSILNIDTIAYYVTMSMSVVFCCRYIISFLDLNKILRIILTSIGVIFFVAELSVLVINLFVPVFFYFDTDGVYHTGSFRNIALIIQIVMFAGITLLSFIVALYKSDNTTKRNTTICVFGFVMTAAIVGQFFFPLLPLYSIGLMIGTCVLHVFIQEDKKNEQYETLKSLASIFYSMHVIDLIHDTVEEFNAINEVKEIANHKNGAIEMMKNTIRSVTTPEYVDAALTFTDLTTLKERLNNKHFISEEFIGNRVGWYLASFIVMEKDQLGLPVKVIFSTRVIDEEKRQKEKLIRKTQTDEMSGLLNRRAYEEDIYAENDIPEKDDFVYVSLDVNGLKIINDSEGHLAGDELITGASWCMKQTLGLHGKLYRIGGDEFVAILNCNLSNIKDVLRDFDNAINNWSGKLVDEISVSYGWVSKEEYPEANVRDLGVIADKRMYEAKAKYYANKGLDRRGQAAAHTALCNLYTKILKINITTDSYSIVNVDVLEQTAEKGYASTISQWFSEFGKSGQVHKDDLENYLAKTDLSYLSKYFAEGKTYISIFYRRKYNDEFKPATMEMIPADDYSAENQSLYLYVKKIDPEYWIN